MTTALTVQTIVQAGLTHTTVAAASAGNTFTNDGKTFLLVTNAHASAARTVTVTTQQTAVNAPGFGNIPVANDVIAIPALTTKLIGPFPRTKCNDINGLVTVNWSDSAADLTVAALKLTKEGDA